MSVAVLERRPPEEELTPAGTTLPILTWGTAIFTAVVVFGFLIRVWDVGGRAMHLDESTVAWFAWQLLTGHGYTYDPVYHGPFQHEMLALIFGLFNSSQTSARMLAVVMGTALVALPWFIRDYLGRTASLAACFLIAISPSFVYFARFERDDTYMEFFTFALVVLALRFLRDRKPWQLYAAVIAFALAFATKESIYIVAFVFATFLALRWAGIWVAKRVRERPVGALMVVASRPKVLALALATPLIAALVLTVFTGLYLPVPAVLMVIVGGGVVVASAAWTRRLAKSSSPSKRPAPVPRDGGMAAGTDVTTGETVQDSRDGEPSNAASHGLDRRWMWRREWRPHWVSAVTIGVGILAVMYSTFGTNLNGLWDQAHPFFNTGNVCPYPLAFNLDACRKDIVGGLFYWLSQHKVARGGQPWYYFLLIFGLYEQIALVFGTVAAVVTFLSRRLRPGRRAFRMFVLYWATLSLLVYSWAGEKFPWLGIHPLLPITLLAAIGVADVVAAVMPSRPKARAPEPSARVWWPSSRRIAAATGLVVLSLLTLVELHNTFTLNFVNGANPVEMMVYVQSAPDTAVDANRIGELSHRSTGGDTLPISIDSLDTWPFAWYLRNMTAVGYPAGAQALAARDPIMIVDRTDAPVPPPAWLRQGYTASLRRLDWWFPEDYKTWTWSSFLRQAVSGSSWGAVWAWETARTPFGPRAGNWYYLYIKKGYFPAF